MNKFLYSISLFLLITLFACTPSSPLKTATFKVWGNCDKCKKTIEGSITQNGVTEKNWNVESKLITVKYDTTLIGIDAIQQLIAKAGYDNDTYYGDDYAYAKLEECCQYDRKPFEVK